MKGCVNNIIPFSSVDGIGNRMIVFFQGCNFNCLYCHNPETIPFYNEATFHEGFVMTPDDIVEKAKGEMPFIRGVTISGGECTASYEFLMQTVKALHKEKIPVLVDTNGFLQQEALIALCEFVDGFMLDIKAVDNAEHKALTGVNNDLVLKSFMTLIKLDKLEEVRTVILGSVVNSYETVNYVSKLIAQYNNQVPYKLIQFRKHGVLEEGKLLEIPAESTMQSLKKLALNNGVKSVLTL